MNKHLHILSKMHIVYNKEPELIQKLWVRRAIGFVAFYMWIDLFFPKQIYVLMSVFRAIYLSII